MRDIACTLLSTQIIQDSIGVEKEVITEKICPIIKVEDVYANEFYQANEQGFKPTLRLRISTLNYSGESELIYMGTLYSIIRTQEPEADEVILVCEKKLKNNKQNNISA